ncbi:MAG: FecR domain-containing protein [Muribaculaceae bacterium]|nr:FecR domain-containing protein [Muribaculaceae bacterium]
MKHLLEKYRTDNLTPDELEELRIRLSQMSDREVADALREDWENTGADEACGDMNARERILGSVHDTAGIRGRRRRRVSLLSCAASIAAIIVVAAILKICFMTQVPEQQPISVATAGGEKADMSLPDGTKIKVNEESVISFVPTSFPECRNIQFSGEAYFNIAADRKHPFTIQSGSLIVTVTGTEFNFSAYDNCDLSVLYLVEGGVEMHSRTTGETVTVKPGEKCEYNRISGAFRIACPDRNENIAAWYSREIRFDEAPLDSVILYLEKHYSCSLEPDRNANADGKTTSVLRFPGTLPTDNLPLAVEALEKALDISISPSDPEPRNQRP